MSLTIPPEIADPFKAVLQQDAQPILDAALSGVTGIAQQVVGKLPVSDQPAANFVSSLLVQFIGVALQGELNILLKHNSNLTANLVPHE